jgi:chromosome segregation ATPase
MDPQEAESRLSKLKEDLDSTDKAYKSLLQDFARLMEKNEEINSQNESILQENYAYKETVIYLEGKVAEAEGRCAALARDKERLTELNRIQFGDIVALRNAIETYKRHLKEVEGVDEEKDAKNTKFRKPLERKTWTRKK